VAFHKESPRQFIKEYQGSQNSKKFKTITIIIRIIIIKFYIIKSPVI